MCICVCAFFLLCFPYLYVYYQENEEGGGQVKNLSREVWRSIGSAPHMSLTSGDQPCTIRFESANGFGPRWYYEQVLACQENSNLEGDKLLQILGLLWLFLHMGCISVSRQLPETP